MSWSSQTPIVVAPQTHLNDLQPTTTPVPLPASSDPLNPATLTHGTWAGVVTGLKLWARNRAIGSCLFERLQAMGYDSSIMRNWRESCEIKQKRWYGIRRLLSLRNEPRNRELQQQTLSTV